MSLQMIPNEKGGGVNPIENPIESVINQLFQLFMISQSKEDISELIERIKTNFIKSDSYFIFQEVLEALVLEEATQENDDNILFLLEHAGPFMEDNDIDTINKLKKDNLYVPNTTKIYFIHLFFKLHNPNLLYTLFRTQNIDPNITNKDIQKTPLESAIEKQKRQPIINCLLEIGATPTKRIIQLDNSQGTNYISNYENNQGVEFSLEYNSASIYY